MKIISVIMISLMLAGCSFSTYPPSIEKAYTLCAKNEGLLSLRVSAYGAGVVVNCVNKAQFKIQNTNKGVNHG